MPTVPYLISFDRIGSPAEGFITTTQYAERIPFDIKRVFWTQGTPASVVRGNHANKATEEVLIAISGSIRVKADTGTGVQEFELSSPAEGLYIPTMCWTELHFSAGAIALCLTSTDFEEADYIRSYEHFKKLAAHLAL
ncbi:MAG: FdtA/QdtA family cupin domain-containing protein [Hymenobacteraceae bacterium]|nr:FdtA/QdtA family cupin domain-containing protein [Hymenobacteraceae bacterium]MDX5480949.1 FdtA/QdtA family cupin domain-containing protein [Hymenobacteraceae bacterium]